MEILQKILKPLGLCFSCSVYNIWEFIFNCLLQIAQHLTFHIINILNSKENYFSTKKECKLVGNAIVKPT